MFKAFGNFIHRTPWWAMILLGIATLLLLVLFAAPVHVIRLSESGANPEEQRAIKREINRAFGDSALNVAENIVAAIKDRATDPARREDMERALAEIAQARKEIYAAQRDAGEAAREAIQEAQNSAIEAAESVAETALEAAKEAREAVVEAKQAAEDRLKSTGADSAAALKAFDDMISSAREKEQAAREALKKIKETKKHGVSIGIGNDGKFAINLPPIAPLPPLPPELREDIRSGVHADFRRIGIGSAMVLAFIPIFIMMLIAKYFIDRSRRAQAFAEQKKKEADVSNVHRQVTEARLQALQAQVEPHFLYNTLANVQALTEVDPAQANQMTGHLIQYLRSSLPKMRENTSTVGQELELVRAYLNILKMRMGDRLAFDIDCPADLNGISFPPMMLPSLVENAIKHGLEPQREGGRIDVVVQRMFTAAGERIRVAVKDTGRGLTDAPTQAGGGFGLSNIRERLIAIYGDAGKLILESNDPKGVVASIEVPVETGNVGASGPSGFSAGVAPAGMVKAAPQGWWGHTRHAVATTHGVWAKVMSVTFITLMIALAVIFGLALAGLYTGMLPMQMGALRLAGVEGMALGTLGLLIGFGAVALALLVVVGLLYGLGLLFAGLVVIIPLVVLISAVPALAPFILIGLAVYWFWWRKRANSNDSSREQ